METFLGYWNDPGPAQGLHPCSPMEPFNKQVTLHTLHKVHCTYGTDRTQYILYSRPSGGVVAGPALGEVQADAGSLCLKEPDIDNKTVE